MADCPAKKQPQDADRVNLSDDDEVRCWSEALGISAGEVK